MGSKAKENLRTILYSSFFLHSTSRLFPLYETVIFQLKLPVSFCWPIPTYLEKDVACNCQLSICLTKQVKMILLSPCLEQLSSFISFTDMQDAFCWTFDFFLIDSCLSLFPTLHTLLPRPLSKSSCSKNSHLLIFFCLATDDAVASFPLQFFLFRLSTACLSRIPDLCNYSFFVISPSPRIFQIVWFTEVNEWFLKVNWVKDNIQSKLKNRCAYLRYLAI